ncbi:MAG: hypothetical protein R2705_10530 [Ilumatobacteraceae bacterium]
MDSLAEQLARRIRAEFSSRPWIVATGIVQGAVRSAAAMSAAGAERVLAIGVRDGVGPLDETVETLRLGRSLRGSMMGRGSMMEGIRHDEAVLDALDPDTCARIDRFDPSKEARVVVDVPSVAGRVAGRATFGARPPAWRDLEDKLAILEVWDAAGVETAPHEIVALSDQDGARAAHARLATELGTVWALDNHDGWHGGAGGTHWARTTQDAERIAAAASRTNRLARVMPFLDGVPCSIHGLVLPGGVAVFRPMEMLIFRDPETGELSYGKAASFWDPRSQDRAAMRRAAAATGAELRRRLDYRGVFTLDGIVAADGFVPTEVNPRFGGALPTSLATTPPLNLHHLHLLAVERLLDDLDAADLESLVLERLDAERIGVGMMLVDRAPESERSAVVHRGDDGSLRFVEEAPERSGTDAPVAAQVRWGAGVSGGLVFVHLASTTPRGPSAAPLVLEVLRLADRAWQVGLPRLVVAPDVRPGHDVEGASPR